MSSMLYVVFLLNNEEYGIEISYAQEILRVPDKMTQIPNMPSYLEGVINVRGKVIPVLDLKKRFGFQESNQYLEKRLLIVDLDNTTLALIVDDVSEIVEFEEDSIEQLNSVITEIGISSLKGVAKIEKRLIILLDAMRLKTEVFENKMVLEESK